MGFYHFDYKGHNIYFKFVLSVGSSMGKIEMMEKEKKASILETS